MANSQQVDVKMEQYEFTTQELEAGSWLRDEQCEVAARGFPSLPGSVAMAQVKSDGSEGLSELDRKARFCDEAKEESYISNLFAQLRALKVKESVISEAIQKFGGGKQGLRAVMKAIMFWMVERNRYLSHSGDSSSVAPSGDSLPVLHMFQSSHASWGSRQPAKDGEFVSFVSSDSVMAGEGRCATTLMSVPSDACSSLWDVGLGNLSGDVQGDYDLSADVKEDYGMVGDCENDCRAFFGLQDEVQSGEQVDPALHSSESQCQSHDCDASVDSHPRRSGLKIRRLSHAGARNCTLQEDLPAFANDHSALMCEGSSMSSIFGSVDANIFVPHGPFSASRMDPLSLDLSSFTSFDMQNPMSIDENMSMTSPVHGNRCGHNGELWSAGSMDVTSGLGNKVADCINSGHPLQELADAQTTTTASSRLARRKRINCNRRGPSRAADGSMVSRGMCRFSSSASRSVDKFPRSQGLPASGVQATSCGDRIDLQYLLEKVLRPSDVGTLGRIVLPKRDAESHLPWLPVREGIQFVCEDYITRESMTLRYRFWPNNKSRMYVLENTGEFVRRHQLKESDRIFIYRNPQNGTYVIRARKGRDCLDGPPGNGHFKGKGAEVKGNSLGSPNCASLHRNVADSSELTIEPTCVAVLECAATGDSTVETIQDNLLSCGDLPDASKRNGTEKLLRFPTLEAFDADMFISAPISAKKDDPNS